VDVELPDGERVILPIVYAEGMHCLARAGVQKDAGGDPDITHGCLVVASVEWEEGEGVSLAAGDGVGIVTKPGLPLAPGEPAINPVPRAMIQKAVREVTGRGVRVTISIPGGRELADKTFNPRLGVEGGLSILGTSGLVRPFNRQALCKTLRYALSVMVACGVEAPVLVPGRIGERAAHQHFKLAPGQIIQVTNEWGFVLDRAATLPFQRLLVVGHPGKLAKLAEGDWDTHSSRSGAAVSAIVRFAKQVLNSPLPESRTAEGIFQHLSGPASRELGDAIAHRIGQAIWLRIQGRFPVAMALVDLGGRILGTHGDLSPWKG
jgi:cobalt-precorrin-5B (C1)-methyltransferase